MARSRNVKPGFFTNEDLSDCGVHAHLLFAGLWTIADREGRLDDRPRRIKVQVLPYYDVDVDGLLDALASAGFISRYEAEGGKYIQIINFDKHQNPHVKECHSVIPAPGLNGASTGNTGTSTGKSGTSHADSLNPITDSLNPIPTQPVSSVPIDTVVGKSQAISTTTLAKEKNNIPYAEIVTLYHETLPELPKIAKLTKQRQGYIRQRWLEDLPDMDSWRQYFGVVRKSKFLMGKANGSGGRPPFRADLTWLCRPENIVKVIEGKYHG